jgi:hypothetical protein
MFAAAAVSIPLLSGCYNGFNAGTNVMAAVGDGASVEIGPMQIRAAVWVRSATDQKTMTLVANFINTARQADTLTAVTTNPAAYTIGITNGGIKIDNLAVLAGTPLRTGYNGSTNYVNAYGINVTPSGFVQTTFTFKNAGSITAQVLSVPPTGLYAGIAPVPPQLGAGR